MSKFQLKILEAIMELMEQIKEQVDRIIEEEEE
jgi:hypothetical protein